MSNMPKTAKGRAAPAGVRVIPASEAKNHFGEMLDSAIAGQRVAIARHGQVKAYLVSLTEYEALVQRGARKLDQLTDHFDAMLAQMQAPKAKRAVGRLARATTGELGRAAVIAARPRPPIA
jgi:prevent-host-death family protein